MVIDLVKELTEANVQYLMDQYGLSEEEAAYLAENWNNDAEWNDVMDTAQNLEIPLTDVTDDDVEEYQATGLVDKIETTMGNALFRWDNVAKAYIIWLALEGGIQQYKNVPRDIISNIQKADSFGSYYNDNLRGNESYEGCGCKANPCEEADLAQIPSKYRSLF